ncbi:hypothetical protein CASFOL_021099 [Castilleja foliolosa]|uniref:Uncharacterized protein n=1 Tax=Castilleja foliolosa TaxID=1961234 RepID=A0ABD3CZE1_9LAMI
MKLKQNVLSSKIFATNVNYKKHEAPSLSDEVLRLVNIRKGGKIDKCLQVGKIYCRGFAYSTPHRPSRA